MRKKGIFFLILCLFATGLLAEQAFVAGMQDVPLMEGLHALDDELFIYDTPEQHIVLSSAGAKEVKAAAIKAFYRNTLPQIGWTEQGTNRWIRDGEKLSLEVEENGSDVFVQFTLETISK